MAFKKKSSTAGTAPYFNLTSVTPKDDEKPTYTDHGVGWRFENKKNAGISIKMNSWPLGDELVAYGKKGGEGELYRSPGNSPDYRLMHASTADDGKTNYTEVGVGWMFDKRNKKEPEAPHGVSFKLNARAFDGNLVAFEFEEKSAD